MMKEPAIEIENLSKLYRLGAIGYGTLRESLSEWWARRRKRPLPNASLPGMDPRRAGPRPNTFWALQDVSATVHRGEILGIIGRNGAGKSTLLKILSRITEPTHGRAILWGRTSSLLEIGAGFHPDLSGRENIYLNGAILGMRKSEITRQLDDIISFADVGPFIDTPVKRYSSGMYVRLAFAVAAHLDPDILIVDEVLAVGDARFQKKCLGKMQQVSEAEGRTVVFVSHNLESIQRLCNRCLLLENGRVKSLRDTHEAVAEYLSSNLPTAAPETWIDLSNAPREGTGEARFAQVQFTSRNPESSGQPYTRGPVEFEIAIDAVEPVRVRSIAVSFYDDTGRLLVNADIGEFGHVLDLPVGRTLVRMRVEALHLRPGTYSLGFWMARHAADEVTGTDIIDFIEKGLEVEVTHRNTNAVRNGHRWNGIVPCEFKLLEVSHSHTLLSPSGRSHS